MSIHATARTILSYLLLFTVIGCVNPQARIDTFEGQWIGKRFDVFVQLNGLPAAEYRASDGSWIYAFVFGESAIQRTSHTFITGAGYSGNAITTGGGTRHIRCQLQVEVDVFGVIRRVEIGEDTLGAFLSSRCYEVLRDYS